MVTQNLDCNLIEDINPGFELGDFTAWTAIDDYGTWLLNDGTYPRQIDQATTPPINGQYSALSDQLWEGTNILYRDIPLPKTLSDTVLLQWADQWSNHAANLNEDQEFRVRQSCCVPCGSTGACFVLNM